MNEDENILVNDLGEIWNRFLELNKDETRTDDINDFRQAIHRCQHLIMIRTVRRLMNDMG